MTFNSLLEWLGYATLTATALAMLVIALRPAASRFLGARATVLLWSIPAIRLVMPSLPNFSPMVSSSASDTAAPVAMGTPAPTIDLTAFVAGQGTPDIVAPVATYQSVDSSFWVAAILMVWAAGAAIYLSRIALETFAFRRAVHANQIETPSSLTVLLADAAADVGVRRAPTLVVTSAVDTPQILGFRNAEIILPVDFETAFTPVEQRHALLHELTHYRRGDIAAAWVGCGLVALQWFNPLAHYTLKMFRLDQESACDEAVRALGVGSRDYANTLMKAVRLDVTPALALTLNHGLAHRIKRMARPIPSDLLLRTATVAIASTAIASAAATAGTFSVQPPTPGEVEEALEGADDPSTTRSTHKIKQTFVTRSDDEDGSNVIVKIHRDGSGDNDGTQTIGVTSSVTDTITMVKPQGEGGSYSYSMSSKNGEPMRVKVSQWSGDNQSLYLASDPFASVDMPPTPAVSAPPAPQPPTPPSPPTPATAPPKPPAVEGGQWVFIPSPPDMSEFEAEMRVFELEMKDFEVDMEGFEASMEVFGKKMGNIGSAIGDLAEACEQGLKKRNTLQTVSVDHPEENGKIKALCVPVGDDRPTDADILTYIDNKRGLTRSEKAHLRDTISRD